VTAAIYACRSLDQAIRALRVQALEIADQQKPEIAPGRQPRPTVVRVESLAEPFDVPVEVMLVENLIRHV
jgi:hypothetical protein